MRIINNNMLNKFQNMKCRNDEFIKIKIFKLYNKLQLKNQIL